MAKRYAVHLEIESPDGSTYGDFCEHKPLSKSEAERVFKALDKYFKMLTRKRLTRFR